jgi:hypothetical protein
MQSSLGVSTNVDNFIYVRGLSAYAAEPGALRCEPLKAALVRSLLFPISLLGLAHTNDCAQHSHPSAAIRAIFVASIICVTVQHSKTENRGILPEMSNFYCHPGRAGGSPIWFRIIYI